MTITSKDLTESIPKVDLTEPKVPEESKDKKNKIDSKKTEEPKVPEESKEEVVEIKEPIIKYICRLVEGKSYMVGTVTVYKEKPYETYDKKLGESFKNNSRFYVQEIKE